MGGIVVKQGLIIAKNESDHFPGIGDAVSGILFLGTPHQGSPSATYANILAQITNIFVVGTQVSRLTGRIRTDLLKSLKTKESELLKIAEDFRVHTTKIKISSFIEQVNMAGLNQRARSSKSFHTGLLTPIRLLMTIADSQEPLPTESFLFQTKTTGRCADIPICQILDYS